MKESQLQEFRERLLQEKSEIEAFESDAVEATQPVALDQNSVGRLSRMDAMQAQEMAQETSRRRQQQLVMIVGALRRIEDGEFGSCFVCGEEIDPRRLAVDPTATHCVACAEK